MNNKETSKLLDLINTRRSIRFFKNKKIAKEKIDKIIEAGLRAPSSKNSQPWFFLVLQGENKNKVCDWVIKKSTNISLKIPELRNKQKTKSPYDSTVHSLKIVRKAPVLIIIFNRGPFTGGLVEIGKDPKRDSMYGSEMISIGACLENILLASHFLGLGAVALKDIWPAAPIIKKKFKIKYDFAIGIAIGYPNISLKKREIKQKKFVKYF